MKTEIEKLKSLISMYAALGRSFYSDPEAKKAWNEYLKLRSIQTNERTSDKDIRPASC